MLAMRDRERAIYTLSVRRPQPHNTNFYRKKEEKGKTVKDKKGASSVHQSSSDLVYYVIREWVNENNM